MRLFCGGISTETNTFSPIPTGLDDFRVARAGDQEPILIRLDPLLAELRSQGHELIQGLMAFAQPAGVTVRRAYESLVGELLDQLRDALPVDAVQLILHGAMVVDGIDDAELDIVQRCRDVVGPAVPIGIELDLHCHIDERLLKACDAIVIYKEYPHVDVIARARELAGILQATAAGEIQPRMALFDCHLVGMCSTVREPMRSFVRDMQAREGRDGVISLSLAHGFPYGDVAHAGAKMLAITDGDPGQAEALAEEFGRRFYALRKEVLMQGLDLETAMSRAVASTQRPTVVADQADNAGGGAPADSTFALRWLLDHQVKHAGVAIVYDPEVVKICRAAGEGATLSLRLGGKTGPTSGDPLDVVATVLSVRDEYVHEFPQAEGSEALPVPLGATVCLQIAGVYVMVSSLRSQCFTPKIWNDFGVDPTALDIIVTKSTNHFMSGHASMAGEVIFMAGDGALNGDVTRIGFRKMSTADKYPWQPDPLAQS